MGRLRMIEFYKTIFINYYKDMASPILRDIEYPFILKDKIKTISLSLLHKQLIDEKYFIKSSIEDILNTLKVKELKEILEKNGIESTGRRKTNMIKLKQLSKSQIVKYLPMNHNQYFSLSQQGYNYIQDNYDYVLIMKYYQFGIDVEIYNKFRTKTHSFFESCEKMFIYQLNEVSNFKSSYSKQVMYSQLSKLYDIYGIHDKALYYALAHLYVEVSCDLIIPHLTFLGLDLSNPISLENRKKEVLSEFDYYISPQDDMIEIIYKNKESFNYKMIDNIYMITLEINLCSKEYFIEIITNIFQNNFNKENTVNKIKKLFNDIKIVTT